MYKFKFADIGEGLHEGVVAEIYKNKGDKVKEGDSLFSVETDKVTSDIPSPVSGIVIDVLPKVRDTIHVGEVIYHIDDGSKENELVKKDKSQVQESAASVVGDIEVSNEIQENNFKSQNSNLYNTTRVLATPLARKLAAKKDINIKEVKGSGTNGRILIKDIENFSSINVSNSQILDLQTPIPISNNKNKEIPISGMRKAIANSMKNSWNNVAYTNLSCEVNMTLLWNKRQIINASLERTHKMKITFTAFIAKATILALKEFPMLNAKVDEKNNKIIQYGTINLGIAVDAPKGLVVPIIHNANNMSIVQIAQKISNLGVKARENQLIASDMLGGTFTLSNYGSSGSIFGLPIINFPEIGLLGNGVISDRVFANSKGEFYNGKVMYLTTAADHRWIDGGDIGRFTSRVKELLEEPTLMGVL